jgi:hypothetical protein
MKLVQLESPDLLKGNWVWVASDGLELEPIFSTVDEALKWYQIFIGNTELKYGKGSIEQ